MNANELADEIEDFHNNNSNSMYDICYEPIFATLFIDSSNMLRQQAKEIEEFRFVLRNLTLATSKKIGELEEELEDCICQGGHSEAYLKVKGR
jgi:hypothetical protein